MHQIVSVWPSGGTYSACKRARVHMVHPTLRVHIVYTILRAQMACGEIGSTHSVATLRAHTAHVTSRMHMMQARLQACGAVGQGYAVTCIFVTDQGLFVH